MLDTDLMHQVATDAVNEAEARWGAGLPVHDDTLQDVLTNALTFIETSYWAEVQYRRGAVWYVALVDGNEIEGVGTDRESAFAAARKALRELGDEWPVWVEERSEGGVTHWVFDADLNAIKEDEDAV